MYICELARLEKQIFPIIKIKISSIYQDTITLIKQYGIMNFIAGVLSYCEMARGRPLIWIRLVIVWMLTFTSLPPTTRPPGFRCSIICKTTLTKSQR